jgi:imidazolonepropionase-like amidohydrolase
LWSFPLAFVFAAGLNYVLMLIINAGLLTSTLRNKIKHGVVVVEDGSITDFAKHGIFEAVVAASVVLALGRIALMNKAPNKQP